MSFSFFYTEKTANIVKNMDDIMILIKEDMDNYKILAIDAIVSDNNIIPGLSGREVNVDKSYDIMKKVGKYSPNLLIFDKVKPNISFKGNYNKYIIGANKAKKEVSLIFKVNSGDSIDKIKQILDDNKIKATFFVDGNFFEQNNELIMTLIKEDYNIGNMGYDMDYSNNKFSWMNTIITKVGKQDMNFCYTEIDNDITLKKCSLSKSYTIKPNIIVKNNPMMEVKKAINNGSIISFNINDKTITELPLVIKYINSRGYNIVNLTSILEE